MCARAADGAAALPPASVSSASNCLGSSSFALYEDCNSRCTIGERGTIFGTIAAARAGSGGTGGAPLAPTLMSPYSAQSIGASSYRIKG